MPATSPPRSKGVGRHASDRMPEERPPAVGSGRQARLVQRLAERTVDAQRCLLPVEALQARRCRGQRGGAVGPLADPPRLPERLADLGAEQAHIALEVTQRHRGQRQAFSF